MEWRNPENGIPKDNTIVILEIDEDDKNVVAPGYWDGKRYIALDKVNNTIIPRSKVIAWMPFPAPCYGMDW